MCSESNTGPQCELFKRKIYILESTQHLLYYYVVLNDIMITELEKIRKKVVMA
jgi:hypothetical protein